MPIHLWAQWVLGGPSVRQPLPNSTHFRLVSSALPQQLGHLSRQLLISGALPVRGAGY